MPRPVSQLISVSHTDGRVTIIGIVTTEYASDGSVNWTLPFTPELAQQEIRKQMALSPELSPVATWHTITKADLPSDPGDITGSRLYRNAWTEIDNQITHDVEKCRTLAMEHLRNCRDDQLGLLDKRWMRAFAKKDQEMADAIELQRQYLRDLPAEVDLTAATSMLDVHTAITAQLADVEAVMLEDTTVALDPKSGLVRVSK